MHGMHDLYQTHSALGSYYGIPPAYGLQAGVGPASLQSPVLNPTAAIAALSGGLGYAPIAPFAAGLQNPLIASLSNPLIAAALQSQLNPSLALAQQALAQQLASSANSPYQQYSPLQPFGQPGSPFGQQFGQTGSPFGSPVNLPLNAGFGPFNPVFGQSVSPFNAGFGQGISPFNSGFGQGVSPFGQGGYPLAPQSWIGQQGGLQGFQPFTSQIHPLMAQFAARGPMGW